LSDELKITCMLLSTAAYLDVSALPTINDDSQPATVKVPTTERQLTHNSGGHILTNIGVWSPDGQWLVYDTRSDPAGEHFDGSTIEMVNVINGEVKRLYEASSGAHCGVATFNPRKSEVVFILGPEHPSSQWQYCPWHRQGVIVESSRPGWFKPLDARDLVPPFTPGALRGGSHLHVWDGEGQWVSFTYEDHVLAQFTTETPEHQINLRNIGVSIPGHSINVSKTNPRNHDGSYFSVLVTQTWAKPEPGSDQIKRAFEEAWVGTKGYTRPDGSRQERALAFQGQVVTSRGETISEVFIVDLPQDPTVSGAGPLEGTSTHRPYPPKGTTQRRLTFTAERKYPGIQGPRHWLRSSSQGERIGVLMKDNEGVVQLWTVSPNGGSPLQVTHNANSIESTFSWNPDGTEVAYVMDNTVCVSKVMDGITKPITRRSSDTEAPRPEACVFSPDGTKIAFVRPTLTNQAYWNQIWVAEVGKR